MSEHHCTCTGPGARTNGECTALREARLSLTEEGRKQLREEYLVQVRARLGEREQGFDPRDLPHRLQKLGVPGQVVVAVRQAQDTKALEAAKRFLTAHRTPAGIFTPLLALVGEVGVGKTVAAVHVLQDFCRRYDWNSQAGGGEQTPPAMFVHASRLSGTSAYEENDRRLHRDMSKARLLVLDDCGEESTEQAKVAMHDILKARMDGNRQTVVTSNLSVAAFASRYGADIADRLKAKAMTPNLAGAKSMRARGAA